MWSKRRCVMGWLVSDDERWSATQLLSAVAVDSASRRVRHERIFATSWHRQNVPAVHLYCDWTIMACGDTGSGSERGLQVRGQCEYQ